MKIAAFALSSLAVAAALPLEQFVLSGADKPVVDSESLQDYVTEKGLSKRADDLYRLATESEPLYGHPTREIGSAGHNATIKYIIESLEEFGEDYYDISTQLFSALNGYVYSYSLVIDGDNITSAVAFGMTPPTPDFAVVEVPLVLADNLGCLPSDYSAAVNGSAVLVQRGECPFGDKSELAGLAGAALVLIYDNVEEDKIPGTLGAPLGHQVASLGLTLKTGEKYVEKLSGGANITVRSHVAASVGYVHTYNVVAETKGGDKDNVVMLGAHSDSVAAGPGINDDGSGTISLLEVASALTNFEVNNAVRFAWWAAEEEGLLGSDYYAAQLSPEENQKIRLFMDYDMMASPNYAYQIYDANNKDHPNGSGDLKQLYVDFYTSKGVNYTFVPFDGRSDYDGFLVAGIPSGGVATGAEGYKTDEEVLLFGGSSELPYDVCYHQLCDDTTNVDYDAWIVNTQLIAHSVATYAESFDSFPERVPRSVQAERAAAPAKYHGPFMSL